MITDPAYFSFFWIINCKDHYLNYLVFLLQFIDLPTMYAYIVIIIIIVLLLLLLLFYSIFD